MAKRETKHAKALEASNKAWNARRYSRNHVEVMMCLLDVFTGIEEHWSRSKENDEPALPSITYMVSLRGDVGSFAVRHALELMAPAVEKLWKSMGDEYQQLVVFDWEFCQDVLLYAVDWDNAEWGSEHVPLFKDARQRLIAHHAIEDACGGDAA